MPTGLESLRQLSNRERSGPIMAGPVIESGKVEPNSGLGNAIGYMEKHWSRLTLFLREPGSPIDNNARVS